MPDPVAHFGAIAVLESNEAARVWDQRLFKQAIAQVRVADDRLIAKACPNEFICHLFSTLHPLLLYLAAEHPDKLAVTGGQSPAQITPLAGDTTRNP